MTNEHVVDNLMQEQVNRNLLRYHVQVQMWCKLCEHILDVRRAVLVTGAKGNHGASRCICAKCWDKVRDGFLADMEKQGIAIEIIDGRKGRK